MQTTTSWKPVQTTAKNRLNSPKNHKCRWYDDTQSCKIFCPNSTSIMRYKNKKFHKRSLVWTEYFTRIFYKVVYHRIIYICVFFMNLDDFFCCSLHEFSRKMWFLPDTFPARYCHLVIVDGKNYILILVAFEKENAQQDHSSLVAICMASSK